MVDGGWSADFSDREGELLYVAVRESQPEVVVEISPCHGYSTNYILAALKANGHGVALSYELEAESEDVIRRNLLEDLPGDALRVVVGDVRASEIPDAGVLLLDSAHEDHFAAWVFQALIAHAGYVVHHDVVVAGRGGGYEPKGWRVGPRESSFVLEALRRSGRTFFSAAAGARYLRGHDGHLAPRFAGAERAILYRGHEPSLATRTLCTQTLAAYDVRRRALEGVRPLRLEPPSGDDLVGRCIFATMLADLGYTGAELRGLLGSARPRPANELSSGELVYYFHYLHHAGFMGELMRAELGGPRCANRSFARTLKHTRLADALGRR